MGLNQQPTVALSSTTTPVVGGVKGRFQSRQAKHGPLLLNLFFFSTYAVGMLTRAVLIVLSLSSCLCATAQQSQLLVVGTAHLNNPGRDIFNVGGQWSAMQVQRVIGPGCKQPKNLQISQREAA